MLRSLSAEPMHSLPESRIPEEGCEDGCKYADGVGANYPAGGRYPSSVALGAGSRLGCWYPWVA
jgi:hypothetical protein